MGVYTFTDETTSKVSADRLFKAMITYRHETMIKLMPDLFQSADLVEGDGGVGSVRKVKFVEGHPMDYFLLRVEEIDEANFHCKYCIFEGGFLKDNLEKIEYIVKYEAVGDGSKAKVTVHYHPKAGHSVNEEEAKIAEEKGKQLFLAVEAYLLENPDIYA